MAVLEMKKTGLEIEIGTWHGFRFNENLLDILRDDISNAEWHISDINDAYEDLHGGVGTYTVCQLCGRVIKHNIHGYGSKCFQTILNMLPKIAMLDDNFKQALDEYNLKKWGLYANTIRELYIKANTNEKGEPKKFRNEFKKSFFKSMFENTSGRYSRKQVDVMIRDLNMADTYGNFTVSVDLENKSKVIYEYNRAGSEELKKAWGNLLSMGDVIKFIQITYAKAWIDNPFKEDFKIEIDD